MTAKMGDWARLRISGRAWGFLAVALLAFVIGSISVNWIAGRSSNAIPIQRAFAKGALETVTPVALAPWWLTSRADLDCKQYMPLASTQSSIKAAISRPRFVFADRKVNSCTLLASVAERKRLSGNMREILRHDGFHSAGSLTLPAITLFGISLTRWLNVLLLIAAGCGGLWVIATGNARDGQRDRIAATLCMLVISALVLAVPGSLTAIPTMAIIVIALLSALRRLKQGRLEPQTILKLAPLVAAALVSLDPNGGSVALGLGCVVWLAQLVRVPGDRGAGVLLTAGFYVLTVILCWLLYAVCVGVSEGWEDAGGLLLAQVTDLSRAGRAADIQAGIVGTYGWLSADSLLGPLGALDLMLTTLFGLAVCCAVKPLNPAAPPSEPLVTALVAIAPVVLWAILYPGLWRSAEEQYVLLVMWIVAVAFTGPFCLIVEGARRLASKRKTKTPPSAPDSQATSFA